VLVYLLWRAGGWARAFLCLAWTLFPLAPALYLKAFAPFELVHDRLLYAPLVGFCMAAALVLQWAAERIEAATHFRVFALVSLALIPLLGLESMSQAVWWQNNRTLFARAITVTPNNPKALANLAGAYLAERRADDAAPLLQRAIQIAPHDSVVLYGMSLLSSMQGDDAASEKYIVEALRLTSRYDLWLQLAAVELRLKKLDVAEAAARQAMKMNFDAEGVHAAWGAVLQAKGDSSEAAQEFQYELHNYPNNQAAREGLAQAAGNAPR
jgi:tetratricopeptide (TPR) repeat protein